MLRETVDVTATFFLSTVGTTQVQVCGPPVPAHLDGAGDCPQEEEGEEEGREEEGEGGREEQVGVEH